MHDVFLLHADDADARSKVAAAVDRRLAWGDEHPALRVVLEGDRLAAETIAALVAGLRRLRDEGGALAVAPSTAALRDALAVTGLDRVFALPLVPAGERRSGLARLMGRFAAGFVAGAVLCAGSPAPAAERPSDPIAIIAKIVDRNPSLTSYQSRLHVDLRLTSFPYIRQHLDGTTYFKRPNNYEVVFDSVPSYAKGFSKLFADIGDPTLWERQFVVTYQGLQDYDGRKDIALRLVQRVRGMIDHETVYVDPAQWTVDAIRYDYYNGGRITMTQTFRQTAGYSVVIGQDAEIAIPHVRAVAHGTYTDYKTNVAVDDAVFTKKN